MKEFLVALVVIGITVLWMWAFWSVAKMLSDDRAWLLLPLGVATIGVGVAVVNQIVKFSRGK